MDDLKGFSGVFFILLEKWDFSSYCWVSSCFAFSGIVSMALSYCEREPCLGLLKMV